MVVIASHKRWRYPLLQDRSLDDRIELLKARIRQADKDIQQLEGTLVEKGSESYKSLANQVLIELRKSIRRRNVSSPISMLMSTTVLTKGSYSEGNYRCSARTFG